MDDVTSGGRLFQVFAVGTNRWQTAKLSCLHFVKLYKVEPLPKPALMLLGILPLCFAAEFAVLEY